MVCGPCYRPRSVRVQNGALTITAAPTLPGAQASLQAGGLPYTSGLITTQGSFAQNQGYFEIRAQTPDSAGFWAAFWMLPVDNVGATELDVLEQPNLGPASQYWAYAKFAGAQKGGGFVDPAVRLSAGYHRYGLLWTADSITFYFDGSQIGSAVPVPAGFDSTMFLIANLAVGAVGSWPGPPSGAPTAQYNIDYIRAYSRDPTLPAVAQQTISSPDGANTAPSYAQPPLPVPPVIGIGPDTLILTVNEDYYLQDAQFSISINGIQQGGVQTAQAVAAFGQTQMFTVLGSFAGQSSTITVNLLNKLNGGAAVNNLNLHILGMTLNGVAMPGTSLDLMSGGPQSVVLTSAAVIPPVATTTGLVLHLSEDAWQGDAHYTVSVDGVPQGGIGTVSVAHGTGATQTVPIAGLWSSSAHVVAVTFLSDAYGGSAGMDRNLYVDGVVLNGIASGDAPVELASERTATFAIAADASVVIPPSTLILLVSEDAWQGDAHYIVTVDGVLQGTVRTAAASHAAGATQTVPITGPWDNGAHHVAVTFLNDAYGGSAGMDRNLYISGVTVGGIAADNGYAALLGDRTASFTIPAAGPAALPPAGATATLSLQLSEDAWQGDAQYQLSVDGIDIGGLRTATASHTAGQSQTVSLTGLWGSGPHSVGVNFVNDAYGGAPSMDRNLYVSSVSLGGIPASGAPAALLSSGVMTFIVPADPASIPLIAQQLALSLSEDAYLGDALFTVSVDGTQLAAPQSVTTFHHSGGYQSFDFAVHLAPGSHDIAVSFLNDLYGGGIALDRNLYVGSATLDGAPIAGSAASLLSNGAHHFVVFAL